MRMIGEKGRGAVVMIREAKPTSLTDYLNEREERAGKQQVSELRHYGIGAQILLDLGIKKMILLSNTQRTIIGFDGYGIDLVGRRPIPVTSE